MTELAHQVRVYWMRKAPGGKTTVKARKPKSGTASPHVSTQRLLDQTRRAPPGRSPNQAMPRQPEALQ